MKKLVLAILSFLFVFQLSAQNLALAESSIGLSKKDLLDMLRKRSGGADPQKLNKPDQTIYHVPNSQGSADMYIYKDTCLEIRINYTNTAGYKKDAALIRAYGQRVQGERTFYFTPSGTKTIYYSLDDAQRLIVAVDEHFFSGLSYKN